MSKYSDESREFRYSLRDETEQSVKDLRINRENFHEVSKLEYEGVIKRFYYTFCDYANRPEICLDMLCLRFRPELHRSKPVPNRDMNWIEFIAKIDEIIPEDRPDEFYFMNSFGWVYEGKLPEIMRVLEDASNLLEDFYILPKKARFAWVLCYCGDGDCMVLYTKEN